MAPMIPEINMESFEEVDLMQSYWKLFPKISEDFVTKLDFISILSTATAPPPDFKVKAVPMFLAAQAKLLAYKAAATTGAAVREAVITGLESLTGG